MARKVLNRKELREQGDAADRMDAEKKTVKKTTKKAAKKAVKKTTKRKSRKKVVKEVRLKAFWGVFSQSLRRVALFEYNQRSQADKKADELSKSP